MPCRCARSFHARHATHEKSYIYDECRRAHLAKCRICRWPPAAAEISEAAPSIMPCHGAPQTHGRLSGYTCSATCCRQNAMMIELLAARAGRRRLPPHFGERLLRRLHFTISYIFYFARKRADKMISAFEDFSRAARIFITEFK